MLKFHKFQKNRLFFLFLISFLILIGLFTRFYLLQSIPVGFYFDEMDYVFTGQSLGLFGTDSTGTWSPIQLQPLQLINTISELSSIFYIFGGGHLVSALFGLCSSILLALISYVVTKKKDLALSVVAVTLVSPWHIYISRVSYEGVISLTFQLLFLLLVLVFLLTKKLSLRKTIFLTMGSVVAVFFSFYTYHGAKFTTIAILLVALLHIIFEKKQLLQQKLTMILPLLVVATVVIVATQQNYSKGLFGERPSELIFSSEYLSGMVNEYRQKSLQIPLGSLVYNKATLFTHTFIRNYVGVFDFYNWGILGREPIFQFSLFVHGFIYLSSFPLAVVGILFLWKKYKQEFLLLLTFFAVSPITSAIAIGQTQNMFRSALTYAILLIAVGAGLFSSWYKWPKMRMLFFIVLCMEAFYFSFVYFSRYPIITADNHYFSEKLVASYRSKTSGELVVAIEDIGQLYTLSRSVLFYTGLQSELSVAERQAFTVGKDVYHFQNTTAQRSCPEIHPTTTYIFSPTLFNECETIPPLVREKAVGLGSPIDSRIYFYIINDTLCDTTLLTHYVYQNSIEMFDTLQLDTTTFCSSWVITQ